MNTKQGKKITGTENQVQFALQSANDLQLLTEQIDGYQGEPPYLPRTEEWMSKHKKRTSILIEARNIIINYAQALDIFSYLGRGKKP